MKKYESKDLFVSRHIGPREEEVQSMLKFLGYESLDELIKRTIPAKIRLTEKLDIDEPLTEYEFIDHLRELAGKNKVFRSYIGMGYYSTVTPAVIQRNIFENPGWYTQYTPYQAEISQGRLEAVINFQTMVSDLTGMELANASLLDEGTAAAEAMTMLYALRKRDKLNANTFFVSDKVFPHTLDVLKTRATPIGIKLKVGNIEDELTDDIFGLLVQYPDGDGRIKNFDKLFSSADEKGIFKAVASDLLSLTLLTPPGEFGADVVVGSAQRFGVPMGYGGPHAAFFATKEEYKRQIPGRIIGASIDSHGKPAYRMALQTREQHIRREKATSNICTAQVLLAIMAGMYAVYHGPKRLKSIALRINNLADLLNRSLKELGFTQVNNYFFDTLKISIKNKDQFESIKKAALKVGINFRYFEDQSIGISLGEKDSINEIKNIINLFSSLLDKVEVKPELFNDDQPNMSIPENLQRKSEFLTHEVFNKFHSETEMMRYIKRLERKDLSLTNSMIPLGSCTMKLNAATEMVGVSLPEFAALHPFVPKDQAEGYRQLFKELEDQLCKITGFDSVSLQPNSGAQGEFAGLMVIRAYHISRGDEHRNVILIPSSAHGTNPASAVMAGGKVVVVKCDENGNIDLDDLRLKAEQYKETLSALMVTYPSTHGVFEEEIRDICKIVHDNGGQVYLDGANLNAQVGLTNPAMIGADVCHINLHKTFCIPHGGGGPGMGPIAVAKHLTPFLPGHSVIDIGSESSINAISAAPWGSSSILLISYAYIKMMGGEGLTYATEMAILNANYIRKKLEDHFKVLYVGRNGNVGHELIFDLREFKSSANIEVEDVAKRLMDYGFHAPTVSFPVPGTVMVEPTESESKDELDRFCDAMISIRNEIKEIAKGHSDRVDNPLKNSPHTVEAVVSDSWSHDYSREKAAFPVAWVRERKFWPSVGRVDNAYGDRNLVCSCLPISDYEEEPVN